MGNGWYKAIILIFGVVIAGALSYLIITNISLSENINQLKRDMYDLTYKYNPFGRVTLGLSDIEDILIDIESDISDIQWQLDNIR